MKKLLLLILMVLFFASISNICFSYQDDEKQAEGTNLYEITEIFIVGLYNTNIDYLSKYLTFKEGDIVDITKLELKLNLCAEIIESSPNYYYAELYYSEYVDEESEKQCVTIFIEITETSFNWIFGGGMIFASIGYRNLFAIGFTGIIKLGYNVQSIEIYYPYIAMSPLSFNFSIGHSLIDYPSLDDINNIIEFSIFKAYSSIEINITPYIKVGHFTEFYYVNVINSGIFPREYSQFNMGFYLYLDMEYLKELCMIGFSFQAIYKRFLTGITGNGDKLNFALNIIFKPFDIFYVDTIIRYGVIFNANYIPYNEYFFINKQNGVGGIVSHYMGYSYFQVNIDMYLKLFTIPIVNANIRIFPSLDIGRAISDSESFAFEGVNISIGGGIDIYFDIPINVHIMFGYMYEVNNNNGGKFFFTIS